MAGRESLKRPKHHGLKTVCRAISLALATTSLRLDQVSSEPRPRRVVERPLATLRTNGLVVRLTVYRLLRRLGVAMLTPGASLLPWREDLVEQLDWLTQDVDKHGGEST